MCTKQIFDNDTLTMHSYHVYLHLSMNLEVCRRLVFGGSQSYLSDLKLSFCLKFWEFFPCQSQMIILYEISYNPCEISLN